jgi:HEAT repeat protein
MTVLAYVENRWFRSVETKRRAAAVAAVVLASAIVSGCAREERGPLLVGGRELKSWLADLHNPRPQVRRQAVLKLGNVGQADLAVAESLAGALLDTDALVRRDAVLAIAKLREPGPGVMERLEIMSRNERDSRVRDAASRALTHLHGRKGS